jgi:hypothetical protein
MFSHAMAMLAPVKRCGRSPEPKSLRFMTEPPYSGFCQMPEIRIPVAGRPLAVARDQLRDEVERLEIQGKRIRGILHPGWAANALRILPDPDYQSAGTYRGHPAVRDHEPCNGIIIVFEN